MKEKYEYCWVCGFSAEELLHQIKRLERALDIACDNQPYTPQQMILLAEKELCNEKERKDTN